MANKQARRRKSAVDAKQKEIIELLASMGKTHTTDGREISSLSFRELDEIYRYGVRR